MKFRNKQTGVIVEGYTTAPIDLFFTDSRGESRRVTFTKLSEFNEEWEDYEVKEPLIKDEKVRNIVREWAVCGRFSSVRHYFSSGYSCFIFTDEEGFDFCLDFNLRIDTLECDKIYTITELCGDEE